MMRASAWTGTRKRRSHPAIQGVVRSLSLARKKRTSSYWIGALLAFVSDEVFEVVDWASRAACSFVQEVSLLALRAGCIGGIEAFQAGLVAQHTLVFAVSVVHRRAFQNAT